ncbi:hypothetical protein [Enterococcus sp. AZ126]|uniref:hypothetical protein n=1 Tax=Enterococcus sp. AZ126 TaxID=2774635 RepID=UPI003F688425
MPDIYDVNRVRIGKVIERGKALLDGEFQLAACIVVLNSNREFLVTQRHPKKQMGLYWEILVGAVELNEKIKKRLYGNYIKN